MKRILLLTMLLLGYMACMAGDGLRVVPRTGEPVTFMFEQQPQVTFLAGKLQIVTSAEKDPVSFELEDVESVDFAVTTGINDAGTAEGIRLMTDAEGVHFMNLPEDADVEVYTLAGMKASAEKADGGEFHLLRSNVGHGIYIVKINQFVTKISL